MTRRGFIKVSQLFFALLIFGGLRTSDVAALQLHKPTIPRHHSYKQWMNQLQQPDGTRQLVYANIANAMISQSPAQDSTFNSLMEDIGRPEAIVGNIIPYTEIFNQSKVSNSDQTTFLDLMQKAHKSNR